MFKRTNKLTALLVAAVAVVAVAPTTANAADRLESKEGDITSAYSYAEGKYVYDGYAGDDDTAVYYTEGETVSEVEDYEDYDFGAGYSAIYGTKFVTVKDGEDDYLLDLSTGKIGDETVEDKEDNIKSSLKTKLKKLDRYEKTEKDEDIDFERVLTDKYGEVWFKYAAKGDDDVADAVVGGEKYIGFVNEDGKYIDVSNTANMYVYSKAKGKTVKFENFGDEEAFGKDNAKEKLKLEDIKLIDQDEDNLYAITTVTVGEDNKYTFFQKISKEGGDKKDGALLPKKVESFEINSAKTYKDGDMDDAATQLEEVLKGSAYGVDVKNNVINVAVKDGDDKVKVYKLKYKKDKKDAFTGEDDKVKTKVDAYIVYKDGDCDEEITTAKDAEPVCYDADGNLWILGKGKVFKFDGSDFKEMYTCDRSMNKLDVYDEKNLVIWDSEGDVFSALQDGKQVESKKVEKTEEEKKEEEKKEEEKKEETNTTKAGWDKNADGTWSFYKDGAAVKGAWVQDGNWYYLKADGIMATGWLQEGGNWYYLNASGAMQTGWVNDNGTWYYMNQSGAMLSNTTVDGYVLGANGAWIK